MLANSIFELNFFKMNKKIFFFFKIDFHQKKIKIFQILKIIFNFSSKLLLLMTQFQKKNLKRIYN
jgi:hypothetical protein